MQASEQLLEFIKKEEGFRAKPYKDVGGYAIGYGFNYYPNGTKVSANDPPISEAQASQMLQEKLTKLKKSVRALITTNVSDEQLEAVTSLAYNIGLGAFKGSTLLKLINQNPNHTGIEQAFKMWNKAAGKTHSALEKRRAKEYALYQQNQHSQPTQPTNSSWALPVIIIASVVFGVYKYLR